MKPKPLLLATFTVMVIAGLVAVLAQTNGTVGVDEHTETKVTESRKGGKYVRTFDVFRDQVLTSRKQEVSVHDDGKIDIVFTKLFRDGKMIYTSSSYKTEKNTIRGYYHLGKLIAQEGDEDGDGLFETMILYDAKEQPVEAFSRTSDGTVMEYSKEKLAELKKAFEKF